MTTAVTAALDYSPDSYDKIKDAQSLLGRRIAGRSFLAGFLRHVSDDALTVMYRGGTTPDISELVSQLSPQRSVRYLPYHRTKSLDEPRVVHDTDPDIGPAAWLRYPFGQTAYSISGIIHSVHFDRHPNVILNLLQAPLEPWDGLICTSRAGKGVIEAHLGLAEEYSRRRFGAAPPRPLLSVAPLGVNAADFEWTPRHRADFRTRNRVADDEILLVCIGRLNPHLKYDPLPLFRAVERAQKAAKRTIRLLLGGFFPDEFSKSVFTDGAARLAPSVRVDIQSPATDEARLEALAGADIFVFPIDNVQETFGLAPVEAMAAGLPIVTSDWDGMKDTVTEDVGIRAPTRGIRSEGSEGEAYLALTLYDRGAAQRTILSGQASIDVAGFAEAIVALADNDELRARMGAAGRKRAQSVYDWSCVIPEYEAFWGELNAIRQSAAESADTRYDGLPSALAPPPHHIFAGYPTRQGLDDDETLIITPGATTGDVKTISRVRRYQQIGRSNERITDLEAVFDAIAGLSATGEATVTSIVARTGMTRVSVERILIWLLKFDLIAIAGRQGASS